MTTKELAEQLGKLAQVQTETLQLIGSISERHDHEMSELRQGQRELQQKQLDLQEAQLELRQAQLVTEKSLARLSDTVDRFIKTRTNGHN